MWGRRCSPAPSSARPRRLRYRHSGIGPASVRHTRCRGGTRGYDNGFPAGCTGGRARGAVPGLQETDGGGMQGPRQTLDKHCIGFGDPDQTATVGDRDPRTGRGKNPGAARKATNGYSRVSATRPIQSDRTSHEDHPEGSTSVRQCIHRLSIRLACWRPATSVRTLPWKRMAHRMHPRRTGTACSAGERGGRAERRGCTAR
jgi:hypothetical protein